MEDMKREDLLIEKSRKHTKQDKLIRTWTFVCVLGVVAVVIAIGGILAYHDIVTNPVTIIDADTNEIMLNDNDGIWGSFTDPETGKSYIVMYGKGVYGFYIGREE